MEEAKYVSDLIGDEYKDWRYGDIITIETHTGSGKTKFILNKLLPYAIENNKRILYLVNRKILKEQIKEDLRKAEASLKEKHPQYFQICFEYVFSLKTYQELEMMVRNAIIFGNPLENIVHFDYIVCDEAHYFISDSRFNTNTQLSWGFVIGCTSGINIIRSSILILMSATLDEIIKNVNFEIYQRWEGERGFNGKGRIANSYKMNQNTNEWNIKIFKDDEELGSIVSNDDTGKWLIFVNDKNLGKKLEKKIKKEKTDDVIFIDSYIARQTESGVSAVENLVKERISKSNILITTSVLDCGVSIEDRNLKNIAIFADNKVSFLQMLGRKRILDKSDTITLYIPQYNKDKFSKSLKKLIKKNELVKNMHQFLYRPNYMEIIFHNDDIFWAARECCYTIGNSFYVNEFSRIGFNSQLNFYYNMKDKFENDNYAFVREQLRWLNYDEEKICEILDNNCIDQKEDLKRKLCIELEQLKGNVYTENERVELKRALKDIVQKYADICIEEKKELGEDSTDIKKIRDGIGKIAEANPLTCGALNKIFKLFGIENYVAKEIEGRGKTLIIEEVK